MSKLIAFLSSSIALFLFIGMAAYFRYYAPVGTFLHRDLDAATVVRDVQQLNTLVTVRYVVQKVVGLTEEHPPLGSESILLMVEGKVLAGIDLAGVTQYNVVSLHGPSVTLTLPPPHIIDTFIDEKNTKVWDRHVTWWTPWVAPDQDLEHKARLVALDDIRKAAKDQGILNDARKNAQEAIRKFLGAAGMTQVKFQETSPLS